MVETFENSSGNILKKTVEPYIDEWDPHLMNNSCGTMPENNQIGKIEEKTLEKKSSGICSNPFQVLHNC